MAYRSRSKLNIYAVICNGVHLENVSAENTRSAILVYCRSNGIAVGQGMAYGECGSPAAYCSKSIYNGFRPCGMRGKCHPTYLLSTGIGLMSAVPTCMGDMK